MYRLLMSKKANRLQWAVVALTASYMLAHVIWAVVRS